MSRSREQAELELTIVAITPSAYLVDDGEVEVWLPASQVMIKEETNPEVGQTRFFMIPEWLALDRGLV